MKLHFKVKFRVLGMTLGTVEDTREIGAVLASVFPQIPAVLPRKVVLYDDRGVLIEFLA